MGAVQNALEIHGQWQSTHIALSAGLGDWNALYWNYSAQCTADVAVGS